MPTVPVVKPRGPMTLERCDLRLAELAYRLQRFDGIDRGMTLLECDRLLDVRLAIRKAET